MSKLNRFARVVRSNKSHKRSAGFYRENRNPWSFHDVSYHDCVSRVQRNDKRILSPREKQIIYDHASAPKR